MSEVVETDVLVVGGGINGAGIARDAAGRGLRVVLCEKDDLASATSSASTKLIHGGLRYLEHMEFRLVRDALREREVLLMSAPHIIWPLRFILPHHRELRSRWLIRLGLLLYDNLGGRRLLPASRGVSLRQHVAGKALKPTFKYGFEYSDCWVQDARLVVLNARDAASHGASVLTRHECIALRHDDGRWHASLRRMGDGGVHNIRARAVVNAAGPWVEKVGRLDQRRRSRHRVRLIKGSHVVVPRLFNHDYPYIFQHRDGRVLFAIAYERDFTLLGTTDVALKGGVDTIKNETSPEEIDYICRAASDYFCKPVRADDVVWTYSGVRPLLDDEAENPSAVTRDYLLDLDCDGAPLLSVYGGKITTYRKLAEQAVNQLASALELKLAPWTVKASLPGGDLPDGDFDRFLRESRRRYPWLSEALAYDYSRNYGTDIDALLAGCREHADLGQSFGGGLFEVEARYLCQFEWARTADDILWRRTKRGLRMGDNERRVFAEWLSTQIIDHH